MDNVLLEFTEHLHKFVSQTNFKIHGERKIVWIIKEPAGKQTMILRNDDPKKFRMLSTSVGITIPMFYILLPEFICLINIYWKNQKLNKLSKFCTHMAVWFA